MMKHRLLWRLLFLPKRRRILPANEPDVQPEAANEQDFQAEAANEPDIQVVAANEPDVQAEPPNEPDFQAEAANEPDVQAEPPNEPGVHVGPIGPIYQPLVVPNQNLRDQIRRSVVELTVLDPARDYPVLIPGIIIMLEPNMCVMLFGGNLIQDNYSFHLRFLNTATTKDVGFEEFTLITSASKAPLLALLPFKTEVQSCLKIPLGSNVSRNEKVFLYVIRCIDDKNYVHSITEGSVNFPEPRSFICDCSPTLHSCYGGLVFDSLGKLVGIGFQHFGPVMCF